MNNILRLDETLQECPGCGSERFSSAYFNNVNLCPSCGLLFRSPRPSQKTIIASYDQGDTYIQWESEVTWRNVMWEKRADFIARYASGKKLLDVGTGDGAFLKFAQAKGFIVEGTEASKNGAARATELGFKVHLGELSNLSLQGPYDIITMWHVLEHVPNPGETLTLINTLLAENGTLVIAVPNELNALLKARVSGGKKEAFSALRSGEEIHLSHFTPSNLKSLVRSHGFEIVHFGVDYAARFSWKIRDFRTIFYRAISSIFGVHPAACMQLVARKRAAS
jgi:2-polyprenyl-3-methyl-5-hydroxy-6-metoxy-1,4-benzoquinol methylase